MRHGPSARFVVNYETGRNVLNLVVVSTGGANEICIYTFEQTHVVVDLNGYFGPDVTDRLSPQAPQRFVDTRNSTKVEAGSVIEVKVIGEGLAPEGSNRQLRGRFQHRQPLDGHAGCGRQDLHLLVDCDSPRRGRRGHLRLS